ncbi:hypothetical protein RJ639_023761 [Escallonia herrerae]|uniref:Reverse transcriptase Ty1/copia-type domain-containing protein n=1 Tax=Escallonia herrerae TaxID=1293975 RepID=A0AA88UZ39_9ASTE|nr:hypothetical protein RJ639_023761 [Escallonia herrerae]
MRASTALVGENVTGCPLHPPRSRPRAHLAQRPRAHPAQRPHALPTCAHTPSQVLQFGCYNFAKEIWDLLAQQYTTADLVHHYQLHDLLHRMKQELAQLVLQKPGIQYRFKPPSHSAAAADVLNDSLSFTISVNDVAELVKQIMSNSGTPSSSALSITSDSDLDGISILKQDLNHHFEMKDLDTLSYFLGLEVSTTSDGYYLSEAKYASDLFSRVGLTDSKTASTPLEPIARFTLLDGTPLCDHTLYRTLVGSLVYLTVTHPDIAYAVHLASQFLSARRTTHFVVVLHILRYIKGTLFHGLHFQLIPLLSYMHTLMLIGLGILPIDALLFVFASFLVPLLFLEEVRNRPSMLVLVRKLNTEH